MAKKTQPKSAPFKIAARDLANEVEKAGESLLKEIKEGFAAITDKVTVAARSAAEGIADTTSTMADKMASAQTSQQIKSALDQVESVAERVVNVLGERFETLKNRVIAATKPVKRKAAAPAKKATKKKTAAKKASPKTAAKKKAAKKKSAAKAKK